MNSPKEHSARQDSIKLAVIGFIFVHADGQTAEGMPVGRIFACFEKHLGVHSQEVIGAIVDLAEDHALDANQEELAAERPDTTVRFTDYTQKVTVVLSANHAPDLKLPFHRFVQLAANGHLTEFGIKFQNAPQLMIAPFPPMPAQPYAQPPAGGYRMQPGHGQMHQGARFTPPSFGQQPGIGGFFPHQPAGSERETYSDEPALAVDAPVVHRTTMIKGVEMLPDDVKLLVFKLGILVTALSNVPPLNDKDFMVTATFKGLEFTIAEAMEIIQTLS